MLVIVAWMNKSSNPHKGIARGKKATSMTKLTSGETEATAWQAGSSPAKSEVKPPIQ